VKKKAILLGVSNFKPYPADLIKASSMAIELACIGAPAELNKTIDFFIPRRLI